MFRRRHQPPPVRRLAVTYIDLYGKRHSTENLRDNSIYRLVDPSTGSLFFEFAFHDSSLYITQRAPVATFDDNLLEYVERELKRRREDI